MSPGGCEGCSSMQQTTALRAVTTIRHSLSSIS